MPREMLSDSLAVLEIVENEDEENSYADEKTAYKPNDIPETHSLNRASLKSQDSIAHVDWACYYNYGLNDMQSSQDDPAYHYKTSSLPLGSSINQPWDKVICSALRIPSDDIANQLTILDLLCFKEIKPEELTSCGWTKANKAVVAPNVVAFTKRFNRVSFWTIQEILNELNAKSRAEYISHFIKVAKRLHELNNLHSLFAIISALRCASIFRLNKTWACLPKKDKQVFDKLSELLCEVDNWMALRTYLSSASSPCIPYLGIFLTDLVYIDIAHPVDSSHSSRVTKMEVILNTIKKFQTSEYDIVLLPHVANYINSVRYIEELQKFVEDDQYKLSLKLEPPSLVGSRTGSKESMKDVAQGGSSANFSLSPNHRGGSFNNHGPFNQFKFIPMHRKCRSWGSNLFGKNNTEENVEEKTPAGSVNLLDDTLLESPTSINNSKILTLFNSGDMTNGAESLVKFESFARRKTVLKNGKKISLSSWQRFWIQLRGTTLVYYAPRSFRGMTRNDFRIQHCKVLSLEGWIVKGVEGTDTFHLMNHQKATLYKFKTGTHDTARQWELEIDRLFTKAVQPLPANLMSFE